MRVGCVETRRRVSGKDGPKPSQEPFITFFNKGLVFFFHSFFFSWKKVNIWFFSSWWWRPPFAQTQTSETFVFLFRSWTGATCDQRWMIVSMILNRMRWNEVKYAVWTESPVLPLRCNGLFAPNTFCLVQFISSYAFLFLRNTRGSHLTARRFCCACPNDDKGCSSEKVAGFDPGPGAVFWVVMVSFCLYRFFSRFSEEHAHEVNWKTLECPSLRALASV